MRNPVRPVLLLATLTLVLLPSIPAAAKTKPEVKLPDPGQLAAREKALRRSDKSRAAWAELAAARRWLVLAGWASDGGEEEQEQRMLRLAELQLDLVQRLVSLARLRAEADRLEKALTRTRQSIVEDRALLKKRGEYLDVLRSTR
jgi:hypothetical protein